MAHLLMVISRSRPAQYAYIKRIFGGGGEVIFDRRVGERRQQLARPAADRRRRDRRQRDITKDLLTFGWALVRR